LAGSARKAGRTKARSLRARHGIPLGVPLPDVLALAEHQLELPVAIFERLGHDLAGAYMCHGRQRLVLLNGSDHPVRLRFTLAHELAHHCFGDDARPDTRAGLARPGHWIEVRANAFAGELLMPEEAVVRWVRERGAASLMLGDVVELAVAFGVSAIVACYRLEEVGAPMDAERVKREIDDGLHLEAFERGEPYDDSLLDAVGRLPYIPERLRGSVLFRAALGELPASDAARRLGVDERELREAWAPLDLLPPA